MPFSISNTFSQGAVSAVTSSVETCTDVVNNAQLSQTRFLTINADTPAITPSDVADFVRHGLVIGADNMGGARTLDFGADSAANAKAYIDALQFTDTNKRASFNMSADQVVQTELKLGAAGSSNFVKFAVTNQPATNTVIAANTASYGTVFIKIRPIDLTAGAEKIEFRVENPLAGIGP